MKSWTIRALWSRFKAAWKRDRLEREFDEELTAHLEMLMDESCQRGVSEEEARRQAIRRLGWPASLRDSHREQRGLPILEKLWEDLRFAFRMLVRSRGVTLLAILSLGLGIGANSALFSLVDRLLLRSLPVREPQQLFQIQLRIQAFGGASKPNNAFPGGVFEAVKQQDRVVSDVVGFSHLDRPLVGIKGNEETSYQADWVDTDFFSGLGVQVILGRGPEPADGPERSSATGCGAPVSR